MEGRNLTTITNAFRQEHLQKLLKQYELKAIDSLGGPSSTIGLVSRDKDMDMDNSSTDVFYQRDHKIIDSTLFSKESTPLYSISTQKDQFSWTSELQPTILEGESLTCFAIGGEKRLCMLQILSTVLKDCPLPEINRARMELGIHCSHCTQEQLNALKLARVLSSSTTSTSLITKTDAERLCNYLLRQRPDVESATRKRLRKKSSQHRSTTVEELEKPTASSSPHVSSTSTDEGSSIPVVHLCFGRCKGRYRPDLYASPSAECIECVECGELFAPDRFVMHSHRNQERRTCHWGFDSANWRAYIHLPTDSQLSVENKEILDQMKLRFDITSLSKRKLDVAEIDSQHSAENVQSNKRTKLDVGDQLYQSLQEKPIPSTLDISTGQPITLPYLLCDPMVFMAFQTLFSASAMTACTSMQAGALLGGSLTPSFLPQAPAITSGANGISLNAMVGSPAVKTNDIPVLQPQQQLQMPTLQTQLRNANGTMAPSFDESAVAAALKLLQLRTAANDIDNKCVENVFFQSTKTGNVEVKPIASKDGDGTHVLNDGNPVSMEKFNNPGSTLHLTPPSKESFKKHLLHLFHAEQQLQQERQRKKSVELPEPGRASVEVIVDVDDGNETKNDHSQTFIGSNESTSITTIEKCDGRVSTETQLADESSASSFDENTGINGEMPLDDLLKRYISDEQGLCVIRSRIATEQRYLEQKLDAVTSENQLLRTECMHLKMRSHQFRLDQQQRQLTFTNMMHRTVKS